MKVYTELEIVKEGLTAGALSHIFSKYHPTTVVEQVLMNDELILLSMARYVND